MGFGNAHHPSGKSVRVGQETLKSRWACTEMAKGGISRKSWLRNAGRLCHMQASLLTTQQSLLGNPFGGDLSSQLLLKAVGLCLFSMPLLLMRSCSLPAEFIDTKFPTRQPRLGETDGRDYGTLKFQLCQISKECV